MSDQLKPINGDFTIDLPVTFTLRDGKVVDYRVANPQFVDCARDNDIVWDDAIQGELDELWDPVRQPAAYFERNDAYSNVAAAAVYAFLPKVGSDK